MIYLKGWFMNTYGRRSKFDGSATGGSCYPIIPIFRKSVKEDYDNGCFEDIQANEEAFRYTRCHSIMGDIVRKHLKLEL